MDKVIVNGFCRCCSSEGPFKGLTTKYNWMGEEEIYSEMLHECFNVLLNNIDLDNRDGICEVCITQLRSAYNFKKQVIQTEDMLKKKCQSQNKEFSDVKLEYEIPLDSEIAADSDNETEFSQPNYADNYEPEYPCKEEPPELRKRKRENEPSTSNVKKNKKTHRRSKEELDIKAQAPKDVKIKLYTVLKNNEPNNHVNKKYKSKDMINVIDGKKLEIVKQLKEEDIEKDALLKTKSNLNNILKYSNATLFKITTKSKYNCVYCFEMFDKPDPIKEHVENEHSKNKLKHVHEKETINNFSARLDVTNLKCTVCMDLITNLEALEKHLIEQHQIKMYTGIGTRLFQFNFEGSELKCVVCSTTFFSIKAIEQHLNTHYRNYTCNICGSSFALLKSLKSHEVTHKSGSHKCEICEESFDSYTKKFNHKKKHSLIPFKRYICVHCLKRFQRFTELKDHIKVDHDLEVVPKLKCNACNKCFNLVSKLRNHERRDHLLERSHECKECSKTLFY